MLSPRAKVAAAARHTSLSSYDLQRAVEPNPSVATVPQESDRLATRLLDPVLLDDRDRRNVAPGIEVTPGSCAPMYLHKGPELPSMPFRLPYGGPGRGVTVDEQDNPMNQSRSIDRVLPKSDTGTRKRWLGGSEQTPRKRARASAGA